MGGVFIYPVLTRGVESLTARIVSAAIRRVLQPSRVPYVLVALYQPVGVNGLTREHQKLR